MGLGLRLAVKVSIYTFTCCTTGLEALAATSTTSTYPHAMLSGDMTMDFVNMHKNSCLRAKFNAILTIIMVLAIIFTG